MGDVCFREKVVVNEFGPKQKKQTLSLSLLMLCSTNIFGKIICHMTNVSFLIFILGEVPFSQILLGLIDFEP